MTDYDVIVVGGGPIGSTYAYKMLKKGYDVAIFDMKNRIGQPLQCAGLVSTHINDTKNLPPEFIDNKIKGANIYSPDNTQIKVEKQDDVAYVLDRVLYDKYLFNRAIDSGAKIFTGTKVKDVDTKNTKITTTDGTFTSKMIAVAAGPSTKIVKKINPQLENRTYTAIQYTVETQESNTDYVDVKIDTHLLPGFIWHIPLSPTKKRVGLFTNASYKSCESILKQSLNPTDKIIDKHNGLIPQFDINKKIVENNTILLGDTASQVKPTTGGGLIVGFNCTDIASITSDKMLANNDNKYLKEYETEYHNSFDKEFTNQQKVQDILKQLSDEDFNYMFEQLRIYNVDKTISEYGDMDNQTPLIKQLLKSGILFKLLPKIGVRRLKEIWKLL